MFDFVDIFWEKIDLPVCWGGVCIYIITTTSTWSRILLGGPGLSLPRANFLLLMLLLFRFLLILIIALPLLLKIMALIAMSSFMTNLILMLSFATNSRDVTNASILSKPALLYLLLFDTFKLINLIFFFFLGVLTQKLKGFFH